VGLAVGERHDAVTAAEGREAVGDEDDRAAVGELVEAVVQAVLDVGVHGRGRLVEDEDPWVPQHRAGERDPLALPAGEHGPAFAHHGVVAVREVADDELVGEGRTRRRLYLLVRGVLEPEGDVGPDGVVEEQDLLWHVADLCAE